ncbi:MAG: GGDEF domain-containing protein [Marinicaulis sp.]|nr:GGDEF domain-containing protein [Marinicaulis sp.]
MKIGETPKQTTKTTTRPAEKTGAAETSGARSAQSLQHIEPSDQIVLLGVPENELTPKVREALITLMEEVKGLRRELVDTRKRMNELEELADRDPLVDLFNRRAFVRELERAMAMIERYGVQASLIFIDLNGLKTINDTMGHSAGDAAIGHVAEILSTNVRQTDIVGRLGGDEFGVLLTQAGKELADKKADDLADKVASAKVNWGGVSFDVSISCGVVEIAAGGSSREAMEAADNAMYGAKKEK